MTVALAFQHFLRTGESDMLGAPWPGRSTLESARRADAALRDALVAEVSRRSRRRKPPGQLAGLDLERFTLEKVVHEAAHVFHNCKRETLGLPATRTREWLLPIDFRKREAFAYACEAYGRICSLAKRPADRRTLVEEHAAGSPLPDETVPVDEYLDILREAAQARSGWKRILARCAAPPSKSMAQRAREACAAHVERVRTDGRELVRSS